MHEEKDIVEAEAGMQKTLKTVKWEKNLLPQEAASAGRASATAESPHPLPIVKIPQGIHLPA